MMTTSALIVCVSSILFAAHSNTEKDNLQGTGSCHPFVDGTDATEQVEATEYRLVFKEDKDADTRPNVVVLVVDDAGLMDFSSFGGEARMPNIDRLAETGARFTGYRTSPLCAPSRAMLLTGVDNHRTGVATIPEVLRPEDRDRPGYSMSLEPGVQTVADRLSAAGYRTYMTGKWHLGSKKGDLPNHHGFDRSFALDASGADNWEQKPYMPYNSTAPWYEDGKPADLPEDFYSSKFLIDKVIDYVDEGSDKDAPFFVYVGFQAIHIPVQAPREFTEKYEGMFDEGWHALRKARWERAQNLGLIPDESPLAPMPEGARDWETLSDEDKRLFSKSMAVHAGMLEAMDFHIGRLITHLEAVGELENTIFVVTSDNGPEPTNMTDTLIMRVWMQFNGYHYDVETLGEKGSMGFIGPEWANATAAPGDLFKFYAAEGGIRVPLIISGAGIEAQAPIRSIAMVTDLTPTILDFAGVEASENDPVPINGRSLRPVLEGIAAETHAATTPLGLEVAGNSALFLGDFKLTRNTPPFGDSIWRLHNLSVDPGETNDLAATDPERMQSMIAHYQRYVEEFGVVEFEDDFDVEVQMTANMTRKILARYWWFVLVLAAILLGGVGLICRMNYRKTYLWISGIGLIPIALSYGAIPEQSLSWLFDISVDTTNLTHVFRAIMGLYFAMVAFWILGAVREKYERAAIQSEVIFMGGLAAGRSASILIDGWPHFLLTGYGIVEILMAVTGIILLRQMQSASQDS